MKKVLLVLFFVVAAVTVTYAQKDTTAHAKKLKATKPHNPADTAHKKVSPMKQIGLTKAQQAKLKTANKDYKTKSKSIKADTTLTAADKKAKLKALNKEKKQQQDTILTPTQKAKLKELHAANKKNSPQKKKPSPKTKTTR